MGLILKEDCLCELDGYTKEGLYARCAKHKKELEKNMTDRVAQFTVTLDETQRTDDVEVIVDAIKMIKGVLTVDKHVSGHEHYAAKMQARYELQHKILAVFKDDNP